MRAEAIYGINSGFVACRGDGTREKEPVDGFRAWWRVFREKGLMISSKIRAFGGCLGTRRR